MLRAPSLLAMLLFRVLVEKDESVRVTFFEELHGQLR
jgi:hypothetical protein